ncbi:TPA: hypothetical protein DDW35_01975 [Candidatus Sumerlaeota bacterium]|jgi:tetratricopeptide (TPR) repeat protein|nr:hypothetical protein [Candidatus Sumerlaeota bacterium]
MSRFAKLETQSGVTPDNTPSDTPLMPDAASYGQEPLTYDAVMRKADASFYSGDFRRALQYYSQALQEDASRPDPWIAQVLALIFLGEMREADVWSARGAERFPTHPGVLSFRGLTLTLQGMTSRGIGTSDFALSQGAPDAICWFARGWILLEADNANWKMCFDKAQGAIAPQEWRLTAQMGLALERYRKWVPAIEAYGKCATANPDNPFLWHHLGICQRQMGFINQAIESQRHALTLKPSWGAAEKELIRLTSRPLEGLITKGVQWIKGLVVKR